MSFKGFISQFAPPKDSPGGSLVSQHSIQAGTNDMARELNPGALESVPRSGSFTELQTVTARTATVNLICGGLGTGMFSLPWAMAGASVLPGAVVIVLVVLVNAWTIMVLVEAAEKYQSFDLGSLLRHLPGRVGVSMEVFTNVMVWVAMMLSLISYLITIHDSAIVFVKDSWLAHGKLPLTALAALLVLPLCFLPQKYLSPTSLVATLANVNLFVLLAALLAQHGSEGSLPSETCIIGFAKGGVTMISAMMQCIIIQMCVLPMYEVLEDRSPQKFRRVLATSFGALIVIFCGFSVMAYFVFGPTVDGNVIKMLPRNAWADVSRVSVIFVVAAVYPIMLLPMLAPVKCLDIQWFLRGNENEQRLTSDDEEARESMVNVAIFRRKCFVVCVTIAILAISFVGALLLPDLGFVNVLDGSLCVGVFTSLVPGLVGLRLLDRRSQVWNTKMIALLCVGALAFIAGLALTKNYYEELQRSCLWRT